MSPTLVQRGPRSFGDGWVLETAQRRLAVNPPLRRAALGGLVGEEIHPSLPWPHWSGNRGFALNVVAGLICLHE